MSFVNARSGVLLLDVLVGIAVFSVIVGVIVYAMLFSQQGFVYSGDRIRAIRLSEKAVEAVKSVRDGGFTDLTEGTFGVSLNGSGQWQLAGTGTITEDGFTTFVTVESVTEDRFQVTAETTWKFGQDRTGTATIIADVADWRTEKQIGDWSSVSLQGAYGGDETILFNDAVATASYAFVSSEISEDGVGLYIFDITNLSTPARVANGFTLGFAGRDIMLVGNTLFILTDDAGGEIKVYDGSDPINLSSMDLLTSIDVPGLARAEAFDIVGDTLFITNRATAGVDELFAFTIEDLGSVTQLDSLDDSDSLWDIDLLNGYAYIASGIDTMELRVADVFDPSDIQFAPGGGYNLSDTLDGTAIASFGTQALLGRNNGDVIEELALFDISSGPVPNPPPGPWFHGVGANVWDIATDPSGRYAFVASEHSGKEMTVTDLPALVSGGAPEIAIYDTDTGIGRGVTYSAIHDRVFLMTNTAFLILRPG